MKKVIVASLAFCFIQFISNAQTATIIAGNGTTGYNGNNLSALSTELSNPAVIVFDKKGNLYYADAGNNLVRKIDSAGNIITVAGTTLGGGYNGDSISATSAYLNGPCGLAFDKSGNLYIADQSNDRIRKVDISGMISTVAGGGNSGLGDGGLATAAELSAPSGVAFDKFGNMYSTDQTGHRVRKVDTNGIITTVSGTGSSGYTGDGGLAKKATLIGPYGVYIDKKGNLYIADVDNGTVRMVDTSGIITTIAGTGTPGFNGDGIAATLAELNEPEGVVFDNSGNLYIEDGPNGRVRRVDTAGIIHSFVSDTGQVIANVGFTTAVNIDANGNFYFIDAWGAVIWEIIECTSKPNINPPSSIICLGQSITLTASGGNGTYTWSPAMGLSDTTGSSVVATPTSTTTYAVTATLGNCIASDTIVIKVNPAPIKPVITQDGDTLFSSALTGNQWYYNDTLISGANGQYLIISTKGSYTVTVTSPVDGCSSTSDPRVTTGIHAGIIDHMELSVFPNPSRGLVIISSSINISEIKVTNLLGQLIYKQQPMQKLFTVGIRNEGVYLLSFTTADHLTIVKKIVVIQ